MTGKTCSIYRKRTCFLFESPPYRREAVSFVCRVQRPGTIDLSKGVIHRDASWRGKKVCLHQPRYYGRVFCTMQPCIKFSRTEQTRGGEGCNDHGLVIEVFYHVGQSIALSCEACRIKITFSNRASWNIPTAPWVVLVLWWLVQGFICLFLFGFWFFSPQTGQQP